MTEYADMNTNDIRGAWPRFTPEALRANTRILQVLNEFGKTRGMTSAQIAMAWMMCKYPFIVPLFGTTKLSHLEEDLRTADFTLTADEINELEAKGVSHSRSWAIGTMRCNSREWNTDPMPQDVGRCGQSAFRTEAIADGARGNGRFRKYSEPYGQTPRSTPASGAENCVETV